MRRALPLVAAVCLAAASCSEPTPIGEPNRAAPRPTSRGDDPRAETQDASRSKARTKARGDGVRTPPGRSAPGTAGTDPGGPGSDHAGTSSAGESGRGASRGDGGATSAKTGSARPDPRSGRYVYAQQGWEEFCTTTCRRDDLPPTQAVDTGVTRRGAKLKVVTEARSSQSRSMRTTSLVSDAGVDITKVELRFGGFANTYEPTPAVRSLRLPLAVGAAWTSSWEAETSGRYSARVVDRQVVVVDGRRIRTFKIDTVTELRGEFRGTLTSMVWVDPDTATALRTSGTARLATDLGRFASKFDTMLIEGPAY